MANKYDNAEYCFKGQQMLRYNLSKFIAGKGEISDFSCEESMNEGNGSLEGVICNKTGLTCHHYITLLRRQS